MTLVTAAPSLARDTATNGTFIVETNGYLLGQAMDWLDQRHVVWHDPIVRDEDGDGQVQIYRSTLDGAER